MIHHRWRPPCRILASVCIPLILCCVALRAQSIYPPPSAPPPAPPPEQQRSALPPAPPCVGCYKGFTFDTVFRMGAHFNGSWPGALRMLKDTLHIGITQMYNQPFLRRVVVDTLSGDFRTAWFAKLVYGFWKGMKEADVKVILQPGDCTRANEITARVFVHRG
jgi:hypothetical protein